VAIDDFVEYNLENLLVTEKNDLTF
jgi:hypothetical protein